MNLWGHYQVIALELTLRFVALQSLELLMMRPGDSVKGCHSYNQVDLDRRANLFLKDV